MAATGPSVLIRPSAYTLTSGSRPTLVSGVTKPPVYATCSTRPPPAASSVPPPAGEDDPGAAEPPPAWAAQPAATRAAPIRAVMRTTELLMLRTTVDTRQTVP